MCHMFSERDRDTTGYEPLEPNLTCMHCTLHLVTTSAAGVYITDAPSFRPCPHTQSVRTHPLSLRYRLQSRLSIIHFRVIQEIHLKSAVGLTLWGCTICSATKSHVQALYSASSDNICIYHRCTIVPIWDRPLEAAHSRVCHRDRLPIVEGIWPIEDSQGQNQDRQGQILALAFR